MGGSSTAERGDNWTSKFFLIALYVIQECDWQNPNKLSSFTRSTRWNFEDIWRRHIYFFKCLLDFLWKWSLNTRNKNQFKNKISIKGMKFISKWKIMIWPWYFIWSAKLPGLIGKMVHIIIIEWVLVFNWYLCLLIAHICKQPNLSMENRGVCSQVSHDRAWKD